MVPEGAKFIRVFFVSLCLFSLFQVSAAEPATLPPANREEAERYFGKAYKKYCGRDYYGALDDLERALKLNTYFVDYYLMRGLVMQRIGKTDDALKSLNYFLEVRPEDTAVPRILSRFREESLFLKDILAGRPFYSRAASTRQDLRTALGFPLLQNLGIKGLGKIEASSGGGLAIADTLGNRLWIRNPGERSFTGIEAEYPVTALFSGDGKGIVLLESGRVLALSGGIIEEKELGTLPFSPSDGVIISENAFAAVSASNRKAGIFSFPGLSPLAELTFPETEHPCEPVAAAVFGEWLAVADRNNGLIFIVSLREKKTVFSFEADAPRDVAWSRLGELFIVHEKGMVSKITLSFENLEITRSETVLTHAAGAWSLFSLEDRIYCLDIAGSSLWEFFLFPDESSPAFLSLDTPSVSREADHEYFLIQAAFTGPYQTYMSRNKAILSSVWNERLLTAELKKLIRPEPDGTLFFLPPGGKPRENRFEAASGKEILATLAGLWKGKGFSSIVIAASIPFMPGDLMQITGFLLHNGFRLFIYGDTFSPLPLLRAAELTGGSVIYSLNQDLPACSFVPRGEIRIPLPSDETSSGFPSRSVLSVYMDIGSASSRDWMPLWPDLL